MRFLGAILMALLATASRAESPGATVLPDKCVAPGLVTEQGFATAADGTRLHYRKIGSGRPEVIYLHGGPGGTLYNGGCEISTLGKRHTLILYDQRGGGRSDLVSDPARLTARHHVEDLEAIRRHLGAGRISLIGLSWGSALAILYADAYPRNVSRLLLVAPMPVARKPFDEERSQAVARAVGPERLGLRRELQARMLAAASDEETASLCRKIMEEAPLPYVLDPARGRREPNGCDYPAAVIRNRSVVARSTLESIGDWDFRPLLARFTKPMLVVEGAQTNIPLSSTRRWASTAPRGRLLLVEDAGHEVGLDQPEKLLSIADAFLSGRLPAEAVRP